MTLDPAIRFPSQGRTEGGPVRLGPIRIADPAARVRRSRRGGSDFGCRVGPSQLATDSAFAALARSKGLLGSHTTR